MLSILPPPPPPLPGGMYQPSSVLFKHHLLIGQNFKAIALI